MAENNKKTKGTETKHCHVIYEEYHLGNTRITMKEAKVPLDMDLYDSGVAYKDNLEYFIQGVVDTGFIVINNVFIPWHTIKSITPCRETGPKTETTIKTEPKPEPRTKKKTRRKPHRRPQGKPNPNKETS